MKLKKLYKKKTVYFWDIRSYFTTTMRPHFRLASTEKGGIITEHE